MSHQERARKTTRFATLSTLAGRKSISYDHEELARSIAGSWGVHVSDEPAHSSDAHGLAVAEEALVLAALRCASVGEEELEALRKMDPGVRELRMKNAISAIWTSGGWTARREQEVRDGKRPAHYCADLISAELDEARSAMESLKGKLALAEPTAEQRMRALMAPGELSQAQLIFFSPFPEVASRGLTHIQMDEFRRWVSHLLPESLGTEWRRMNPCASTLASLVHKLRFTDKPLLAADEEMLLRRAFRSNQISNGMNDILASSAANGFNFYSHGPLTTLPHLVWGGREPLLEDGRASMEFETVLDLLGIAREAHSASIDMARGICIGSMNLEGDHASNDDSKSSLEIRVGGRHISLDSVFDGVSGHHGGSVASSIAKQALEVSALAGWIRCPEDVRRALVLADIAINMEKKRTGLHDMGTTATISYFEGNRFYSVNCGDSKSLIVRGGKTVFSSNAHGFGNRIWAGLGIGPRAIDINNKPKGLYEPIILQTGDAAFTYTDGIGDTVCEHELAMALPASQEEAVRKIVSLADSRRESGQTYKTTCGCPDRGGKDDDISLFVRFIRK